MKASVQYSPTARQESSETAPLAVCLGILILFCCLISSNNSVAATGDELIITGNIVNLRAAPSTNAEPLIKLLKDRKVTEIRRQNDWVEVETYRKDIKTGWVHQSLLNIVTARQNTSSPTGFERFMQRFNDQNEVIKKQSGDIYFSEIKNKGHGQIDAIATEAWLNADQEERGRAMNVVFKLWNTVVPVGSAMSVSVIDKQAAQHMVMLR